MCDRLFRLLDNLLSIGTKLIHIRNRLPPDSRALSAVCTRFKEDQKKNDDAYSRIARELPVFKREHTISFSLGARVLPFFSRERFFFVDFIERALGCMKCLHRFLCCSDAR